VRVFGSLARGENEPGSDIDLLIELGGERSSGGELLEVLELYDLLSALAGIRVDVVTARSLRPEVRGTCCCRGDANSESARGVLTRTALSLLRRSAAGMWRSPRPDATLWLTPELEARR